MNGRFGRSGRQAVEEELVPAVLAGQADDPRLSAREAAALRYADQMWHDHSAMTDEAFAAVTAPFDTAEFVELAFVVAQFIAMGQLVAMLGIPNPDLR